MDSPFDLVSFVARAENRIEVLLRLASEPWTRSELQDETGIPRATLSRILADFWQRDLVAKEGHQYAITPLGSVIAADLRSLFESVDTMQRLQAIAAWLPLDEIEIDLNDILDAELTLPTQADPMAPMKHAAAVLREVERVQALCPAVVHEPLVTEWRGIVERGQQFEGVVTTEVLDVVSTDPEMADRVRDVAAADNAALFVCEEAISYFVILADSMVLLVATDEEGAIQGIIETDDEDVRSWAEVTIAAYRDQATPIVPELLTK